MPLSSFIREEACRLGFAAVGIAAVGPCQTLERFNAWLNKGYADGMPYLAKHAGLRADPRLIMPDARSMIVVAARYPSGTTIRPFSNYTRGRDYHDVLRGKLKQLVKGLESQSSAPVRTRVCVDSAPILEREWAVRAGLGWIGKQGSLVNPRWGCTLFLGELLVNMELKPSLPASGTCGACHRCIEACPTGAIQADGFVDARRCLAYLTIEHQGAIPDDLCPFIGPALFGCDRCTSVCPRNRVGADAVMQAFDPDDRTMPSAEQCLRMGEAEFKQCFSGTAVYRSGLARLKRNAAIAVANRRKAVDNLSKARMSSRA